MSFAQDRDAEQMARAKRIAIQLAGNRASRQLVMSMLALVKSVEGDGSPEPDPVKKPVGARKVLEKPKKAVYERVSKAPAKPPVETSAAEVKRAPKAPAKRVKTPTQEGLW